MKHKHLLLIELPKTDDHATAFNSIFEYLTKGIINYSLGEWKSALCHCRNILYEISNLVKKEDFQIMVLDAESKKDKPKADFKKFFGIVGALGTDLNANLRRKKISV
ncbi:MAG: hypothetical protein P0116_14915 [Candidatus Nitrosocosmicus sp.]|nr:hypothetical protein [Candidatus Nitrosocosmicus sp.]